MLSPERLANLRQKLFPGNFSAMSGKMAAIVGYILGVHWTDPEIREMHLTSDGFILARTSNSTATSLDSSADLMRNWRKLLRAAELTAEERKEAHALFVSKIEKHGRSMLRPRENPSVGSSTTKFPLCASHWGDAVFTVLGPKHYRPARSGERCYKCEKNRFRRVGLRGNPGYTLTQQEYRNLKSRLTRAKGKGPSFVRDEVRHAANIFADKGYPDDWNRWRIALEDAAGQLNMEGKSREASEYYRLASSLFESGPWGY